MWENCHQQQDYLTLYLFPSIIYQKWSNVVENKYADLGGPGFKFSALLLNNKYLSISSFIESP
jgi:hypothetical protein